MLNFNQNFECLTKPVIQREKIAYTDVDKNSHLQLIRHHVLFHLQLFRQYRILDD